LRDYKSFQLDGLSMPQAIKIFEHTGLLSIGTITRSQAHSSENGAIISVGRQIKGDYFYPATALRERSGAVVCLGVKETLHMLTMVKYPIWL
jgi:hypothetical protein